VLAVAIGVGVTWQAWPPSGTDGSVGSSAVPLERRETRPTLDPAEFVGRTQLAYQVAREMPAVLDRLRCYCECDRYYGHQTLLSCYTDRHAAT
jgi:hypothetical protein